MRRYQFVDLKIDRFVCITK